MLWEKLNFDDKAFSLFAGEIDSIASISLSCAVEIPSIDSVCFSPFELVGIFM